MPTMELSAKSLEQLGAIAKQLDKEKPNVNTTLAGVIAHYYTTITGGDGGLPEGWTLNEDITLSDLETYYTFYHAEKPASPSAWIERGRTLRAAVNSGWLTAPGGLTVDDIAKLKPTAANKAKRSIDLLYERLTTDDPNE